ncbi:MAG: hypothetical protein WB698_04635 [Solirubrobacteraceae bacterium]
MRIINVLCFAFTVALALAACVSPASALENFEAKTYPVLVKAVQKTVNVLKVGSSPAIECETASFMGQEPMFLPGPTKSLLLNATYGKCKAFGFSSEITILGCLYLLMLNGTSTGTLDIKNSGSTKSCEEKPISIRTPTTGCEITIGVQSGLSGVTFTNESNGTVVANLKLTKIAYKVTKSGLGCPKEGEESTYSGEDTGSGETEAGSPDEVSVK